MLRVWISITRMKLWQLIQNPMFSYLMPQNQCRRKKSSSSGVTFPKQVYTGRRNESTFLKEVSFVGNNSYIATGGDCGNLYIWEKTTGKLVQLLKGDGHVVNGVAPHPFLPLLATCGIDSEGKVFSPGDKNTFDQKYSETVMKENNEDVPLPEGEPISLFQLWDLLTRIRREGENIVPEDEEEEGEETESHQEYRDKISRADSLRLIANDLFKNAKYQEAIAHYDDALSKLDFAVDSPPIEKERVESRVFCMVNKAACFLKMEQYDQVIAECNSVLSIQPKHPKALYRRAQAFISQKDYPSARKDLLKALSVWPDDQVIRKLLDDLNKLEDVPQEKQEEEESRGPSKFFQGLFKKF